MVSSRAKQFADRVSKAPESFDPADVDGLADETTATSRKKRHFAGLDGSDEIGAGPGSGKLRLRAQVPVLEKYKGRVVDSRAAFGKDRSAEKDSDGSGDVEGDRSEDNDEASGDEDMDGPSGVPESVSSVAAGAFSISGDLEAEYAKMMNQTQHELEVMRMPSATEVSKRESEGQRLKERLDTWSSLVEFRIHLEGALNLAHRFPVAAAHGALCGVSEEAAKEAAGAAKEVSDLLGSLSALQETLADGRGVHLPEYATTSGGPEAAAWEALDARLSSVLDWSLSVADDWKERTRLDARRSFKVLDQSLATQMEAVTETAPEKLLRRCTPQVGRHSVFAARLRKLLEREDGDGSSAPPQDENGEQSHGEEADIFDDRDHYVQLLREVLAGGGDGAGTASAEARDLHAAELEGRRSNKKRARNDVERRASKGRKIRYVPIERLQNFMAPRSRAVGTGIGGAVDAVEEAKDLQGGSTGLVGNAADVLMHSLFAKPRVS